ncbi:polysaccharide biosynthesis/export family protein [Pseudoruegeria sp. SHC-113]|nr:polysaccharide biosynthesis/export family protein [Pseudoruegeria sp. SHC-113]
MASSVARAAAFCLLCASLVGCTLPRSGPNKEEIYEGSVQRQGDAFIITVNDRVTRATSLVPALGFSQSFQNAGVLGSDTISPGDTLAMTIWENSDVPLLGQEGVNFTQLAEVQVDGSGHIFVPYAGRVRAAGNTPEALRQIITEKLDTQTPDPQVLITRAAGDGSTVSVVGGVAGQGVYPIERPSRTLSGMLAQAGGITTELEITQVNVIRGGKTERIWLTDLYKNPHMDIALRNGDRIVVEEDTRDFTVLGATGAQSRVPFETQTISAIEALALVGGLNSNLADPTGVFVMRNEPAEIANTVLGRSDLQGAQRMVYVLNLTEPNGMFMARDFVIREDDTVYVTEAPYVRWQKTFNAVVGPVNTTASLSQLAN